MLLICIDSIQITCTTKYMTYAHRAILYLLIISRLVLTRHYSCCLFLFLTLLPRPEIRHALVILLASGKVAGAEVLTLLVERTLS